MSQTINNAPLTALSMRAADEPAQINTPDGTFTVVFANTISSTTAFTVNGATLRLGEAGQAFLAIVPGQSNATPPPNAYFGGYALGAGKE